MPRPSSSGRDSPFRRASRLWYGLRALWDRSLSSLLVSPYSKSSPRGVSPVIGSVLIIAIVVLLALTSGVITTGFTERLDDTSTIFDEDACPGFQRAEFDVSGENFDEFLSELQEDNCALWLRAGEIRHEDKSVSQWRDLGPNGFHATQSDPDQQPELVYDETVGADVLTFRANHDTDEGTGYDPAPGETDGDYLALDRNVGDLGVEKGSGIAIVAVVKPESFNRGAVWTAGEAGEDGKEFSMRTCSNYAPEGCDGDNGFTDPEGWWRGQHFGDADVDFDTGDDSEGEWIILTHAYNGEEFIVRVNGEEIDRRRHDLDLSSNRNIQIGKWERTDGDPMWYYNGSVAEMTIFDRTLAPDEMVAVEAYMSTKFDIALDGI